MTHGPAPRRRACSATHEEQDDEGGGSSVEQPPPPDGGWGWVVVFASFSIHIVTDGVTYSFGVFYNEFLKYFNEGAAATAWIASILVGVTLCSGPISSSFVNKYGCRAVTIAGSILAALCMGLSVFAPNVLTLYFTIGIGTGFGFGLIYLPAIVSVTCYFEKYRSLATGIAVCGSGLGTFVFAPLTDHLIVEYGWRGALAIIAAIVLNCIILGALFRPVEEYQKPIRQRPKQSDDEDTTPKECDPLNTTTNVLSDGTSSNLHRPRSIGHLTVPRSIKVKQHLTTSSSDVARLALSQPVLSSPEQRITFGSHQALRKPSGIMYRRDIFYRGSLHNIPYHRSNPWLSTLDQKQHLNDDNVQNGDTRQRTASFSDSISRDTNDTKVLGCIPCSKETADTLREMLDFSLLLDPIFILFTISNFFTSIGFNMPYVYIVAQAEERGIQSYDASYLLSIIGMSNLVGRVILGYLSDKTWVNRLMVYNLCLTICGVATGLCALCYSYTSFCVYASVFGFTIGAYVGLTSVILVDLLGLDRLTNAFGLLLLFQGIASLLGPPIGGWLYDALKTYDPAFYVAGFAIAISGLMLFAIPSLQRYLTRRQRPREKLGPPTNGTVTQSVSV